MIRQDVTKSKPYYLAKKSNKQTTQFFYLKYRNIYMLNVCMNAKTQLNFTNFIRNTTSLLFDKNRQINYMSFIITKYFFLK